MGPGFNFTAMFSSATTSSNFDFAAEEAAYLVQREFEFEQSQLEMVMRKLQGGRSPRPAPAPSQASRVVVAVAARPAGAQSFFSFDK